MAPTPRPEVAGTLTGNFTNTCAMQAVYTNVLDATAETADADAALRQIDAFRRLMVGPGICSVQLNVTTADDPRNEVRLQRFYSSSAGQWPVQGRKRKTLTPWTERLFVRGQPFVAEGWEAIEQNFDDHALMRPMGLNAVINVPILRGNLCFATFNVFGTRGRWLPQEVLAARVLALAAARWVSPPPDLHYSFDAVPEAVSAHQE